MATIACWSSKPSVSYDRWANGCGIVSVATEGGTILSHFGAASVNSGYCAPKRTTWVCLTVDTRRRQIGECAGMADEPVGWQRPLLLELQRALDASGDEVEEFVESGAFSLFVKQPNLHPVSVAVGEQTYRVWSSTGELIICDDLKRWSRFRLALGHRPQFPSYSAHGSALDVGELVCMVAISPELAALVAQCLPESNPGATEPLAEQRRRPRRRRTRRGL